MTAALSSVPAADFVATKVEYAAVLPMFIVFGMALVGVLVEAFAPRRVRYPIQLVLTLGGLVAAFLVLVLYSRDHQAKTAGGAIVIDGPALFLQGTVLVLGAVGLLAMAERLDSAAPDTFTQSGSAVPGSPQEAAAVRMGATTTEVFPLVLFAISGMMMFPAAGDLLTMFVALEVLSLPLYILTGLARRRRLLSQEASLKYFLLGAFSSAFFLFGSALIYGFAGSVRFGEIAKAVPQVGGMDSIAVPGVLLIAVGLLFKIGAVPFHSWTPDVYQGAPTPVTGFMAACTKIAAFGALLRVLYVAFEGLRWNWQPVVAVVAALTMIVGAVLSVTQTDVKRLLAYSSITHAGFVLVGVLAMDRTGVSSTMFYLVAYGFSTIAAFALIALVRSSGSEATHLSQWAGLGKSSPVLAGAFSFLMLAFAGIPLTSGFTAKFAVFGAAIAHDGTWLAVIGVLASAVTAFVYVRVIVLMYFSEPSGDTAVLTPSVLTSTAVTIGVAATLLLGIVPSPLLDLAHDSSLFLP
ncbi:NADH-quinone oxidoreductase subunit NuoN [Luteipulveratus sp. YIM 133132]|uniref:NADH-quinone oxidoreductase subunit N n=1 Tax=Luteipulveratus flavus TaxID=3031728 RepID=A0ABT6C8D2_9MICO|nr:MULTISPECIES: NADH-quinone oxidoreductase subunit NuoN [unclassified Luteipulveratus]MDE9365112.1 NADH-quinone oxidoreductase subunit NuoN [Luteipulveratus sp. YIM 133132]MDF8264552.1 NADH-quinone oxidoreductase subunit NuoN [Luteipulveratus sp. YIM 133296]